LDTADVPQAFYGLCGGMAVFVDQNGNDVLTASQRSRVIDALTKQIKITTGYLRPLFEGENAGVWGSRRNDNSDPFVDNWAGFDSSAVDRHKRTYLDPACRIPQRSFLSTPHERRSPLS
jgi:hypothetical protein